MKGKWTPAVVLALMLLAFVPPLVWRLGVGDMIITPSWERRVLALAILTPLVPGTGLMVAAVRRTLRPWVVVPLVGLMLLGIIGGGALMTVLTKDFIFEDKLLRTERVEPEELHLYDASFLGCRLKVYAAKPGALYARLVLDESFDCNALADVRARWAKDGKVEVFTAPR